MGEADQTSWPVAIRDRVRVRLVLRLIVIWGALVFVSAAPRVIMAWGYVVLSLSESVPKWGLFEVVAMWEPLRNLEVAMRATAVCLPGLLAIWIVVRGRKIEDALCAGV